MNRNPRWLLATTVLAVPVLGILAAPSGQSVTLLVPLVAEVSWVIEGQRRPCAHFTVQALKYDPAGAF